MSFKKSGSFWFTAAAFGLLLISVGLALWFWDWLHPRDLTTVSNSETLRNVGLLIAGGMAFVFALWRGWVAERQAAASQQQTAEAQRQAETAQRVLLNERYQTGAEMLGNAKMAVRLGGIYALERLAAEHPEEYHVQVMKLFCGFVRFPTEDDGVQFRPTTGNRQDGQALRLRADVQDAVRAIGSRSTTGITLEKDEDSNILYLPEAQLIGLQVQDADLSGAWLTDANLSGATLPRVNLSCARLVGADLSSTKLWGANLSRAILRDANMSGTDLFGADARSSTYNAPVRGLTQDQLDSACADSDNQPKLAGVLDAKTGKQLVWRGKTCDTVE